jgi:Ca2+-binding RTX toxin-like protein
MTRSSTVAAALTLLTALAVAVPGAGHAAERDPLTPALARTSFSLARNSTALGGAVSSLSGIISLGAELEKLAGALNPDPPADPGLLASLRKGILKGRRLHAGASRQLDGGQAALLDIVSKPETGGSALAREMRSLHGDIDDARLRLLPLDARLGDLERDVQHLIDDPKAINQKIIDSIHANIAAAVTEAGAARKAITALDGPLGRWYKAATLSTLARFMRDVMTSYTCGGQWATIRGDAGDNYLEGTGLADVIVGGAGNDEIWGDPESGNEVDGGADIICGGYGDDTIRGKAKNDVIYGGPGNDTIFGGRHNNTLDGGAGDDYIQGGGGSAIDGGTGNDTIFGGTCEEAYCESMDDIIHGGDGDDVIYGSSGNDTNYGDAGSDLLYGQQGHDTLYGGASDGDLGASGSAYPVITWQNGDVCGGPDWDYLWGGTGDDALYGQGGKDYMHGGEGNDYLEGGYGGVLIPLGSQADARDCLWGEEDDDTLHGRDGDDFIHGGDGSDILFGEGGDDYLEGYTGDDGLYGDAGNDSLFGDSSPCDSTTTEGNDMLYGGAGDDKLRGGPLEDTCDGETGVDNGNETCEVSIGIP